MRKKILPLLMVLVVLTTTCISLHAQSGKDYVIVENYYKVKWGFADEFISL